ncbi:MAG: UDP-N-acetylmuramate dehydrogenase [Pseudanabaenaceae cyanobacterium]
MPIRSQVPLAGLTTLKVGGTAEFLAQPRSLEELLACWYWAQDQGLPVTVLGAGSNLLISDRGLGGLVLCTRYLRGTVWGTEGVITALAGEPLVKLAWQASDRGWGGMEWAVGIPGTVGGMVYMNAGAQGGCCADILMSTQLLTPQGQILTLPAKDLCLSYRYSALQGVYQDYVLLSAELQLKAGGDPQQIKQRTMANCQHRHSTQPYHLPSCGSVFRNPHPHVAGKLIDQAGLKGYQIGQAQVSLMHANFIVNLGGATAREVYALMRHVQAVIKDKYGIVLQPEVKMLGQFDS